MRRVSRFVVVALVLFAPIVGVLAIDHGAPANSQPFSNVEDVPSTEQNAAADTGVGGEKLATRSSTTAQEFDSTTFVVTTYANGTATFTIRYERRLENESQVDQFESFEQRFENESTDMYAGFQSRADSLVATGRNTTGRDMTATEFQRDARVEERFNTLGIVEMSFTWSGFAPVRDDGRVAVGDVFEGGIYLGPNQALVFKHGPDVAFESVDPEGSPSGDTLAESDSVTWTGEREFADNRPRIVLAPPESTTTTDGTTTADGGDGPTGTDGTTTDAGAGTDDGLGMLPMIVLAFVAVLFAAFAYREYGGDLIQPGGDSGDSAGTATASSTTATSPDTTQAASAEGASSEPAVSDEELLTDEDRVLSLLEEHGGRMRQVNIVEQTGWSKSKVSMLLSDMEDADDISKLRVGRENIISLDGQEPDVAGSPFDDEDDPGNDPNQDT